MRPGAVIVWCDVALWGWQCYVRWCMSAMYKHLLPWPLKHRRAGLAIKWRSLWRQDEGKSSSLSFYGFIKKIMSPLVPHSSNIHPQFPFMAFKFSQSSFTSLFLCFTAFSSLLPEPKHSKVCTFHFCMFSVGFYLNKVWFNAGNKFPKE